MRPMEKIYPGVYLKALISLVALTGLILGLEPQVVLAQNAAQAATLARLNRLQSTAHPYSSGSSSGVEATTVPLYLPTGLAFDASGDLFIADAASNVIREVDLTGILTTVVGTGEQGYGGDGGPAASALLDTPSGIAVDASGNLYIADTHNSCIREVSAGVIQTIAGTGISGFSGDGGVATAATLSGPIAVAVDTNGTYYIADTKNHRIRAVSGGIIQTVAGNGEQTYSGDGGLATAAGLDTPSGIAVDSAFNLYIGDTNNNLVRMVTHATGIISTLAGTGVFGFTGDGSATGSALAHPHGLSVDSSGTVYVADSDNHRIRIIAGGQVTTVAGNGNQGNTGDAGATTSVSLNTPQAVAVQSTGQGTTGIAVADTLNQSVVVSINNTAATVAGTSPTYTESFILNGATSVVYGSGTLTATFANGPNVGTGLVTFYDGLGASPSIVGTAPLTANTATLNTSLLGAGIHSIVASYAGDASNPAIASGVYVLVVTPVPLIAVANPVSLLFGQAIPALTGSLNNVLAQDTGKVSASFTTAATATSDPGSYPIAVALTGPAAANYTVSLGTGSGSISIAQAPSQTVLTSTNQTPILGTTVTLKATIASTTSGTPSGTVSFYDGTTLLNSTPAPLSGGVASLALTTLPVGAQSVTAVYNGSTDFIASTSTAVTESVLSPDFSVATSTGAQTVIPGQPANYSITITPTNSSFVYPVTFTASGLPSGVTASFSPSSFAVGAGTSTTVLTLNTSTLAELQRNPTFFGGMATASTWALLLLPFALSSRSRKLAGQISRYGKILILLLVLAIGACAGCGGGGFFSHGTNNYTVTVTAVSGPSTHSTSVTLTIQ